MKQKYIPIILSEGKEVRLKYPTAISYFRALSNQGIRCCQGDLPTSFASDITPFLLAEICIVDDKPIAFDELIYMDLEDYMKLCEAFSAVFFDVNKALKK